MKRIFIGLLLMFLFIGITNANNQSYDNYVNEVKSWKIKVVDTLESYIYLWNKDWILSVAVIHDEKLAQSYINKKKSLEDKELLKLWAKFYITEEQENIFNNNYKKFDYILLWYYSENSKRDLKVIDKLKYINLNLKEEKYETFYKNIEKSEWLSIRESNVSFDFNNESSKNTIFSCPVLSDKINFYYETWWWNHKKVMTYRVSCSDSLGYVTYKYKVEYNNLVINNNSLNYIKNISDNTCNIDKFNKRIIYKHHWKESIFTIKNCWSIPYLYYELENWTIVPVEIYLNHYEDNNSLDLENKSIQKEEGKSEELTDNEKALIIIKEKAEKIKQQIYNKYWEEKFKKLISDLYIENPEKVIKIKESLTDKMEKVVDNDSLTQDQKLSKIASYHALSTIFWEAMNESDEAINFVEDLLNGNFFNY